MEEIIVSNHANSRMRERIGINKKSCQRLAEKAYNDGIASIDATGELRNYMNYVANKHHNNAFVRLYGDKVFIYAKEFDEIAKTTKLILVTVIQIPNNLTKKNILTQKKKKAK